VIISIAHIFIIVFSFFLSPIQPLNEFVSLLNPYPSY